MNHMNRPYFNHPIDPLPFHFQETLSKIPGTSQSLSTAPEIISSTSSQSDEQRPDEEPSKPTTPNLPMYLNSQPGRRRHGPHNSLHPFSHLRGRKDMKYITMSASGESEESRTIWHGPGHRRWETPPDRSEMGLGAQLVRPFFYIMVL